MGTSNLPPVAHLLSRPRPSVAISSVESNQRAALTEELHASLTRESAWRQEYAAAIARQRVQLQEFEHRVFNGLQMVVSMLALQGLRATPETAAQLAIASGRIAALGHVHQRLHAVDDQDKVGFREYLKNLCDSLSKLVFEEQAGHAIVLQCSDLELPAVVGMPLGLIANELITNSAKHAQGNITVRVEASSPDVHALSVSDDGPGLPAGFDPAKGKGLGMKIVLALVQEIGGELHVFPGDDGRGARFTVKFSSCETGSGVCDSDDRDRQARRDNNYDGVLFLHFGQANSVPSLASSNSVWASAGLRDEGPSSESVNST
jgi:two-component sensor histidine kinase